jgi:acetyl-CoA C-acetyltransferase
VDPARTPVIVGVGQVVERGRPVAPLDLVERAARAALDEAPGIDRRVQRISVVNIINGGGPAPAGALARRLRINAARTESTTIGGNTPQWLVTRAASAIAAGEGTTTLIAGGEAVRSLRDAPDLAAGPRSGGPASGDPEGGDPKDADADVVIGDDRPGLASVELSARLMLPAHVYPLFESALAAVAERTFEEQRAYAARFLAPFTKVAAGHPCAWFRDVWTAAELADPEPDNRIVAEPYTKRMNAHITVDQAAALVVTSLDEARSVGAAERCVFVHSGADANDVWFPLQRPDLSSSPGIRAAARAALAAAAIGVDDLAAFDLYSCFPCAVEMAADALGVALDDERGLTVTGGLPYFGGPGNNYSTHAVATMVDALRERGGRGLVSALGWFVTKHAVGVYGVAPPEGGFRVGDTSADQAAIDASALAIAEPLDRPTAGRVEASTVIYDKTTGDVSAAPAIVTLPGGRRTVAVAHGDDRAGLAGRNLVGATVTVEGNPARYRVD